MMAQRIGALMGTNPRSARNGDAVTVKTWRITPDHTVRWIQVLGKGTTLMRGMDRRTLTASWIHRGRQLCAFLPA